MRYYVRTTGDRVLDKTYSQIDYELLIDHQRNPIEHFIQSLRQISESDSLLLEDDLVLCKDFTNRVNDAISAYPGKIVNFFSDPRLYLQTIEHSYIAYNQCTFYPKGIAENIADVMDSLPRRTREMERNRYSLLETDALKQLGLTVVEYRPHLVQHLDFDTLLFPKTYHTRRSIFFADYIDELGIRYIDAKYFLRNLCRLQNRHFEELCKQRQLSLDTETSAKN